MIVLSFVAFVLAILVLYGVLQFIIPGGKRIFAKLLLPVLGAGFMAMGLSVIWAMLHSVELQTSDPLITLMMPWTYLFSIFSRFVTLIEAGQDLLISWAIMISTSILIIGSGIGGWLIATGEEWEDIGFVGETVVVVMTVIAQLLAYLIVGGLAYFFFAAAGKYFGELFILGCYVFAACITITSYASWIGDRMKGNR